MKQVGDMDEFQAALKGAGDSLVCVDFTAAWCGPCQMIGPKFSAMAQEFADVTFLKVDVDEAQDVAQACAIRSMPTFHFYHHGKLVEQFSGADEQQLRAIVGTHRYRHFDILVPGTRVTVAGLQNAAEHNGKEAVVVSYDAAAQRYVCRLPEGKELALKSANTRQTGVRVSFLPAAEAYGGAPGGAARIVSYDEDANEYAIVEEPLQSSRTMPPDCVLLPPGTRATTAHLGDMSRNGVRTRILSWDVESGRYTVLAKADGSRWKLKPGNLLCV